MTAIGVAPIRLRKLRLIGAMREYSVDFELGTAQNGLGLAIIAGEISTGKTTILEFIDYCLGAKRFPEHDEVMVNVRSALLEIEIAEVSSADDDSRGTSQSYVIERPLGLGEPRAWVYRGALTEVSTQSGRSFATDPADPESLSQYLLRICGLSGLRLREAPTQEETKTSVLSFRDIQPLWYLSNRRMDNADLVLEKNPYRSLKLRQVVDYFFGVSDGEASSLARQIEELRQEGREVRASIATLRGFLGDAGISDTDATEERLTKLQVDLAEANAQLRALDSRLAASTGFASDARARYARAAREARSLDGRIRERESLIRRIEPLRSQYADDIRKLEMLQESQFLFDALSVNTCPACQTDLGPAHLEGGQCSLCGSTLPQLNEQLEESASGSAANELEHEAHLLSIVAESVPSEVLAKERRSLSRRIDQLQSFVEDVSVEADQARARLAEAQRSVLRAQTDLDSATEVVVAPFVAERDQISRRTSSLKAQLEAEQRNRDLAVRLRERENYALQTESAIRAAVKRQREMEALRRPRDSMLARLGKRFEDILRSFGYPKVDQVRLQKNLVPVVRNKRYDLVGSSGAMTLIALAWQLAIFELAVEEGTGHPGFLLIDSPQKNLKPGNGSLLYDSDVDRSIEADRQGIVERVYLHIESWLRARSDAQIIIVDNEPPSRALDSIIVRYSADAANPPYGLIDNADGTAGDVMD